MHDMARFFFSYFLFGHEYMMGLSSIFSNSHDWNMKLIIRDIELYFDGRYK